MRRVFTNIAFIIDSNGTYHMLDNYPRTFDSKNYSGDERKAYFRATGDAHATFGAMCLNDTRKVQSVVVLDESGNNVLQLTLGDLDEEQPGNL